MRAKFLISFLLFTSLISLNILGQPGRFDSIMYRKNLRFLPAVVPTYYSINCENRARAMQSALTEITKTYSGNNPDIFKFKIAVLDSLDWPDMPKPYGFFSFFYNWIIIPGDLNYSNASRIKEFKPLLKENLSKVSKTLDDALSALYKFCMTHEVGHYYNQEIRLSYYPDRWTMELLANYFAYDFLYKTDKAALQTFQIITNTYIKEYIPKFRTISSFNNGYFSIGQDNYSWYQSMLFKMTEDIYSTYKFDFMESFAKAFQKRYERNPKINISDQEVTNILDSLTKNIYSKWVKIIEKNTIE